MKGLFILLILVSAGSLLSLAWMLGSPPAEDPRIKRLEQDLIEAKVTIVRLKKELAQRSASESVSTVASASALSAAGDPSAPGSGAEFTPGSEAAAAAGEAAQAANPSGSTLNESDLMRIMQQQMGAQIDANYAKLSDKLRLNPQEKEHFKNLLLERAKAEQQLGLRLMKANATPEEKQAVQEEAQRVKEAYDQTFQQFLNDPNDWKTFQNWEETKLERQYYESFGRSLFNNTGQSLTSQDEEMLINMIHKGYSTVTREEALLLQQVQKNPGLLTEQQLKQVVQIQNRMNERILNDARPRLSPFHLQALKVFLDQLISVNEDKLKNGNNVTR